MGRECNELNAERSLAVQCGPRPAPWRLRPPYAALRLHARACVPALCRVLRCAPPVARICRSQRAGNRRETARCVTRAVEAARFALCMEAAMSCEGSEHMITDREIAATQPRRQITRIMVVPVLWIENARSLEIMRCRFRPDRCIQHTEHEPGPSRYFIGIFTVIDQSAPRVTQSEFSRTFAV